MIKGLTGLGIGIASGAVLGAVSYSKPESKPCPYDPNDVYGLKCAFSNACIIGCTRQQATAIGGVFGGAAGLVVGTIVGVATGHETWIPVRLR